jgi:hypothetical protein
MSKMDICNTSYGKNKGRESNWQFDSRPPKVGNRLWGVQVECAHRWKTLDESYKFTSDLIPIEGLGKELWPHKVAGIQTRTVSGLLLGNPGIKSHSNVGIRERCKKYYMGEGGGFPRVRAMVNLVSPKLHVVCPSTKGAPESDLTNLLVG